MRALGLFRTILVLIGAAAALAQPGISLNEVETMVMFLDVHSALLRDIDQRLSQKPTALAAAQDDLAKQIGISRASLIRLVSAYQRFKSQLELNDQQARAFFRKTPTASRRNFQQFEENRGRIIASAVQNLRTLLGVEWIYVDRYVQRTFRSYITKGKLPKTPHAQN